MKVGVGADHGGFEMKQQLAGLLEKEGHEVVDFGNDTTRTTTIRILHFL
jgi:ribose 5-phosphate isomerase B